MTIPTFGEFVWAQKPNSAPVWDEFNGSPLPMSTDLYYVILWTTRAYGSLTVPSLVSWEGIWFGDGQEFAADTEPTRIIDGTYSPPKYQCYLGAAKGTGDDLSFTFTGPTLNFSAELLIILVSGVTSFAMRSAAARDVSPSGGFIRCPALDIPDSDWAVMRAVTSVVPTASDPILSGITMQVMFGDDDDHGLVGADDKSESGNAPGSVLADDEAFLFSLGGSGDGLWDALTVSFAGVPAPSGPAWSVGQIAW